MPGIPQAVFVSGRVALISGVLPARWAGWGSRGGATPAVNSALIDHWFHQRFLRMEDVAELPEDAYAFIRSQPLVLFSHI